MAPFAVTSFFAFWLTIKLFSVQLPALFWLYSGFLVGDGNLPSWGA